MFAYLLVSCVSVHDFGSRWVMWCDDNPRCLQLTSKSPETFLDLTDDDNTLSELGFNNGQMVRAAHWHSTKVW